MNNRRRQWRAALAMSLTACGAAAHDTEKLGDVHFPISCSARAQEQFERGLAMLYSFWFPEAPNAFAAVAEAEPDCAMANWGMAISARGNPLVGAPTATATRKGWELLQKARAAGAGTQRERDYVDALDEYYRDWEKREFSERVLAYEKAMERLSARYPDDSEAAVFHALAMNEAITVAPPDKTYSRHLKAAAVCEKVLARQPDHPGALHFLIHSYDFPALAKQGVPAANHYATVAPSAPHALHMPSHIYSMLGMWEESIQSNELAVGVAQSYVHAMDFMVYAHLQLAQDRQARELVERSETMRKAGNAAQRTPTGALLTVYTAYAAIPARYAIERGAWTEAVGLGLHPTAAPADAITHFTRAMGFARLGDAAAARNESRALQGLQEELIRLKDTYWANQVGIQHTAALAWAAHADGNAQEAVKLMRAAADQEDASEKHVAMENRLWPMRELLGELLLEIGEPAAALVEFEKSLQDSRNRLRGLHGAARAAERVGEAAKAKDYYARMVSLGARSDTDRKELAQARAYLAIR